MFLRGIPEDMRWCNEQYLIEEIYEREFKVAAELEEEKEERELLITSVPQYH